MIEEDITDIVAILRECADDSRKTEGDYYADQYAIAAEIFDEAANVIERLRSSHAKAVQRLAYEIGRLRLTDAEREAVEWAVAAASDCEHPAEDTLRSLLERRAAGFGDDEWV